MQKKTSLRRTRRGPNWNRDDLGRPLYRAKTWGEKKLNSKKNRRNWKNKSKNSFDD